MNIIDKIENEQLKDVADFNVGDSLKVHTRVVEGGKERIQIFAGLCLGRKGEALRRCGPILPRSLSFWS